MIAVPKLSYNVQRSFSTRASLLGYFGVLSALVAAVVATLLTKGQVWPRDLHYLTNFTEHGFNCNSTTIYPGQQFGGVAFNSSLSYASQNNFAYSGQKLSPCSVKPGYSLEAIGPPPSWPTLNLNYTITCAIDANSNATFGTTALNHGAGIPSAESAWDEVALAMNVVRNYTCYGSKPVDAFRVDRAQRNVLLFSTDYVAYCTYDISNASFKALTNLATLVGQLIEQDFTMPTVHINPLPDVLYPCTKAEKVWAPTSTILVECYTAVAATLGPALLIVTWMLRKVASVDQVGEDKIMRKSAQDDGPSSQEDLTIAPLMKHDSD